jgi:hypothetical protein
VPFIIPNYDLLELWGTTEGNARRSRPPAEVRLAGELMPPRGRHNLDAPLSIPLAEWQANEGRWIVSTAASIGQIRLQTLADLAGTPAWRTERLTTQTVESAFLFLGAFEREFGRTTRPIVSPIEDGGIMIEWEEGGRELLVEVLADGTFQYSKFENGAEVEDGAGDWRLATALAQWMTTGRP